MGLQERTSTAKPLLRTPEMRRCGISLIEVVVAIAVLGTLAAILLPAVAVSRESARSMQCGSRLRQVGIALQSFEEVRGFYPTHDLLPNPLGSYIERAYEVLVCPSDARQDVAREHFEYSYLLNDGTRFFLRDKNGFASAYGTATAGRALIRETRVADFTDGLSNTAAASERLITTPTDVALDEQTLRSDPVRFLWYPSRPYSDEEALRVGCIGGDRQTPFPISVFPTRTLGLGYSHILPPNRAGCYNAPYLGRPAGWGAIAISATSGHLGYVNLLYADGTVRQVHDEVSLVVWSAIGTRNGDEPIPSM